MPRRSRSGMPETTEEVTKLSRADLEDHIQRCAWGAENGGTSQGRKSYFKRLTWLKQQREILYDVPAPRRAFRVRSEDQEGT